MVIPEHFDHPHWGEMKGKQTSGGQQVGASISRATPREVVADSYG